MNILDRKILINSYPRSGSTTFLNAIRASVAKLIPPYSQIFFHEDSWICKAHIPLVFLGTYPDDVGIYTIVRDPLDAIVSNVYRWSKGYTGNIVNGNMVVSQNQIRTDIDVDETFLDTISHQINQYISYVSLYIDNQDKITAFSYDAVQTRIADCLDLIFPGSNIVDYEAAKHAIDNPINPTMVKTEIHSIIKRYVENSSEFLKAVDLYQIAKTTVAL